MAVPLILSVLVALPILSIAGGVAVLGIRYRWAMRRLAAGPTRLGARGSMRYLGGVYASIARTAWWRIGVGWKDRSLTPAREPRAATVLCVHGFLATSTCFTGIRRALATRGRSSVSVDLGRPWRSIEAYAPPLRRELERLRSDEPGRRVDVLAHSMGGLVLRRVLADDPRLGRSIRTVVTLGTPHRGTPVSRMPPHPPEVRQMTRGSAFLERLPDFRELTPAARVVSVAADPDLLVFPVDATRLPGASRMTLHGVSHLGLLTDPVAIEAVVELLDG
jgi:pimeloyl-ACP methyl ester carboxylesterase